MKSRMCGSYGIFDPYTWASHCIVFGSGNGDVGRQRRKYAGPASCLHVIPLRVFVTHFLLSHHSKCRTLV